MRSLISALVAERIRDYLSRSPLYGIVPRLYPPAGDDQISALNEYMGQELERSYREFLSLTDGMDEFYSDMRILGFRDWREGMPCESSLQFLEILRESGTPADVGLPEDVNLAPVAIDGDAACGIFSLQLPNLLPERFWWIGEGSSMFFHTFANVLQFANGSDLYSPRESVA